MPGFIVPAVRTVEILGLYFPCNGAGGSLSPSPSSQAPVLSTIGEHVEQWCVTSPSAREQMERRPSSQFE